MHGIGSGSVCKGSSRLDADDALLSVFLIVWLCPQGISMIAMLAFKGSTKLDVDLDVCVVR